MNRTDLQRLSEDRLADGVALLAASRWAGAYYMLGYAVECALKAAMAKRVREHEFPSKQMSKWLTHSFDELFVFAELKSPRDDRIKRDPAFELRWNVVKDWNEQYRYESIIDEIQARALHEALTDPTSGVLPWLKTLW